VAAAAVAGGRVEIDGVSCGSGQGDRAVIEIVERAGVGVTGIDHGVVVEGPATRPISAGVSDAPDLFPALAAVAASIPSSTITGVEHLKHKESDRLAAMDGNLRGLGAELVLDGGSVQVTRPMARHAGVVRRVTAAGDHRIAMAMAVAALYAGPLEIDDPGCVNKSFPSFWKVWRTLTSPAG
jgi:3-phosphoshikimate 1-carboxyvinyltransferase